MRNAVLRVPRTRSSSDRKQVLRAAIRQLERADLYLGAILAMELADREADRALVRLRGDVEALRRHLVAIRLQT